MKICNFGIIGMGNRGRGMFQLLKKNRLSNPAAVCDTGPERLSDFQKKGVRIYKDYHDLLNDKNIDAVFITTPDFTHGEILDAAVRAGKNAICEKPLEITEEKLRKVLSTCGKSGRTVAVGYVLRYAPLFQKAKELVKNGAIGRLISVNAVDNINYGGYAFFHDWHRRRENVTSLLLQKATHSLDIVDWLVDSDPVRVAAFGGLDLYGSKGAERYLGHKAPAGLRCGNCEKEEECPDSILNMERVHGIKWQDNWPDSCVYADEVSVDDNQSLIVQYRNGVKLTYLLNQFTPGYKREYSLIGDKGQLRFDDESKMIKITERASRNTANYTVFPALGHGGGDEGLVLDFLRCCRTGEKPVANLESSAAADRRRGFRIKEWRIKKEC